MKLTGSLILLSLVNVSAWTMPKPEVALRHFAGSVVATSTILSNVLMVAVPPSDAAIGDGPTQLLAARSGGRAGGRARSVSRPAAPTIINRRTTVIQAPAPYSSGLIMSPGYYAPPPSGLGLAIGINAVSGIADGFREARQENELRSTRDQLTEARIKEAEMEARLRQLEQQQQQLMVAPR
jgi:hypothetical protein